MDLDQLVDKLEDELVALIPKGCEVGKASLIINLFCMFPPKPNRFQGIGELCSNHLLNISFENTFRVSLFIHHIFINFHVNVNSVALKITY